VNADTIATTVVARLDEQIEAGAGTWSMPWRQLPALGLPTNAATGNTYQGGNLIALTATAIANGWPNRWATYRQWADLGAQVRTGEHATWGLYWRVNEPTTTTDTDPDTGDDITVTTAPRRMWARGFAVFNAAQVDHDPTPTPEPVAVEALQRITHADTVLAAVPAIVRWGSGNPCYRPVTDDVCMPTFDSFHTSEDAYATLCHELAHWTAPRLGRTLGKRFGDHAYAAEELVAELSAALTCTTLGIDTVERCDHAAYLASWCQLLTAEPATLWTVASKAQAATDHLLTYSA
jgi:antirestriction protein ArdC